jgi:hypothetical protein
LTISAIAPRLTLNAALALRTDIPANTLRPIFTALRRARLDRDNPLRERLKVQADPRKKARLIRLGNRRLTRRSVHYDGFTRHA